MVLCQTARGPLYPTSCNLRHGFFNVLEYSGGSPSAHELDHPHGPTLSSVTFGTRSARAVPPKASHSAQWPCSMLAPVILLMHVNRPPLGRGASQRDHRRSPNRTASENERPGGELHKWRKLRAKCLPLQLSIYKCRSASKPRSLSGPFWTSVTGA